VEGEGVTRSLPLMTERQQSPPKKEGSRKPDGDTLVTQMVNLAVKCAEALGQFEKAVVALDAYFSKVTAFLAADNSVCENGERKLEIVTRGRDDSTGYTVPGPRPKGKRGANRKYGEKIVLWDLFKDMSKFTTATLTLYGKPTEVRYLCMDLIWKPLGHGRLIRFVVVESKLGRMVLMSSDLTLDPEDVIVIFGFRFKIETSFNEQKNDNACFSYHFWTTALQKRKRWTRNDNGTKIDSPQLVNAANRAINSYLCLGTISTGIMTIIAFSHNRQIWKRYPGWIKTLRSRIPTIAVVKDTIAQDLPLFLQSHQFSILASIISSRLRFTEFLYDDAA